jgi:hypothetical protein
MERMITEAQSLQLWQEIIKAQSIGWSRNINIRIWSGNFYHMIYAPPSLEIWILDIANVDWQTAWYGSAYNGDIKPRHQDGRQLVPLPKRL